MEGKIVKVEKEIKRGGLMMMFLVLFVLMLMFLMLGLNLEKVGDVFVFGMVM